MGVAQETREWVCGLSTFNSRSVKSGLELFLLGDTPFQVAADYGTPKTVQLLIALGANVNHFNRIPRTALHMAAREGRDEIVKVLLAHGADVEAKDDGLATPLIYAASRGQTNAVRLLLANKADINVQTDHGYSALSQAARWGHKAVVDILLSHNAKVELEDETGKTALGWALENDLGKPRRDIAEILRSHGATKLTSNIKRTGIHSAVCAGDLERVKALLAEKPDLIRSRDKLFDSSPLHQAAAYGRVEIVKLLLENKADVTARDAANETPLHTAARAGQRQVVELLIAHRADPLALLWPWTPRTDLSRITRYSEEIPRSLCCFWITKRTQTPKTNKVQPPLITQKLCSDRT